MKTPPEIIIVRESLAQSLLADLSTFGWLLLCIGASWKIDSLLWQGVVAIMWLLWFAAKLKTAYASDACTQFNSYQAAQAWLEKQIKS